MSFSRQSILFISGLDKSVNEQMLYGLFNEFPISYIKIAKDHQSKLSFGYAFVGFKSHSKAEEAILKLNYSKIGKKTIRISWYNREPNNYRNHPDYNLFVKKLDKDVSHKEFHDHFSKFGTILSARLVEDEEGEVVGYGFVLYDNPESATQALNEMNGSEWKGKKIYVGRFIKNKPKTQLKFNNIYVRNIPKIWSREDLEKFFSKFGPLGSVLLREPDKSSLDKLPEEKRNQILSYNYAFICFKDFNSAQQVVNTVPYHKLYDEEYNSKIDNLAEAITPHVESGKVYMAAHFIIENIPDWEKALNDESLRLDAIQSFNSHLTNHDNVYIIKDKSERLDCCQALKKSEREKKKKQIYDKIKKIVKDKYKFCNLYVKNLPDNMDDETLMTLFSKFGEIKSAKTMRREMTTSYLGIKTSLRVFGFVCFFDSAKAREAKMALHGTNLPDSNAKLFVDYHQTKQERADFLKLKMINKVSMSRRPGDLAPMMRGMPIGNIRPFAGGQVFGPHLLRKFPPQAAFTRPNMMGTNMPGVNLSSIQNLSNMQLNLQNFQNLPVIEMDKNLRRDFFGDQLYTKISTNPAFNSLSDYFSKIVGIFLDLENIVIERLIKDDVYFNNQVLETIRLLNEKTVA